MTPERAIERKLAKLNPGTRRRLLRAAYFLFSRERPLPGPRAVNHTRNTNRNAQPDGLREKEQSTMQFNGKRTDPLELPRILRVDPELGRLIRTRAAVNRRTIQQELLHLIESRLNVDERGFARLLSRKLHGR